MNKAEKIYEAIGSGYGFNGSKEAAIKIIQDILDSPPTMKDCDHEWETVDAGVNICKKCNIQSNYID